MGRPVEELFSTLARSGPPLFFPDPDVPVSYNFDQGLAAPETFPLQDFQRIAAQVLERDGTMALEYFEHAAGYREMIYGNTPLRAAIAGRVARRDGRGPGADGVILTSGSVQAIALATQGLLDPGDVVLVEASTFPYLLRYVEMRGAAHVPVPMDGDGLDLDALEAQLHALRAEGRRVKMVYTIATFQLPTGVCLSLGRRKRLVALAKEWDFFILEDNVYGDLRYSGETLPTLLALDDSDLVVQADGFSKTIAPGLRLGWAVGSERTLAALAAVRQDLGVSQWIARILADYLAEGKFEPHLERANAVYRRKRDIAVAALRQHCGDAVSFRVPDGAFYLWLELSEDIDWDRVAERSAAEGVFCRPGETFTGETGGSRFLRMAFSHISEAEIARGVEAFGRALADSRRSGT